MTDWIMILILAMFGIIGYQLMGLIDRFMDRHTAGCDRAEWEKGTNEPAKPGKIKRPRLSMPVFFRVER
ncbi:MAG: hypothetical protein IKQ45_04335 [Clostridia bacterium]|nr:hypothetical protein [Clostridia bacterium]